MSISTEQTALVRKESVTELCLHRELALEAYARAFDALVDATKAHARSVYGDRIIHTPGLTFGGHYTERDRKQFLEGAQRRIDQDMWRSFISGTPIGSLMDAQERKRFEDDIEKNPAEATEPNVLATMERLLGESDAIFRRGLVNAFKSLSRDYASNDGFRIGERIVLTYCVAWEAVSQWFTLREYSAQILQDVDRVMHVLDGREAPNHQQGLCAALRQHTYTAGRTKGTTGQTDYWRYRFFKNGNMHLFPLRRDLLDRANRIIAEHYGMVVPVRREARKAEPTFDLRPGATLKEDFFASPPAVCERLIALAQIEPHHLCLEPSAGNGILAEHIYQIVGAGNVVCIEKDAGRAAQCAEWQFDVRCADFLSLTPEPRFDRIVMNPPFSGRQDIAHVLHALKFLKPGGRLVAVMGSHSGNREDRAGVAFRHAYDRCDGARHDLPAGSFKDSGTGVRTVAVVLTAPLAQARAA